MNKIINDFEAVSMVVKELFTKHSKMIADIALKDLVHVKELNYGDKVLFEVSEKMTNAEKFEKIFHQKPATYTNPCSCDGIKCEKCNYYDGLCKGENWWNEEYLYD